MRVKTELLVNSPKEVATYDLQPEMSAYEVCDKLVDAIKVQISMMLLSLTLQILTW